MEEETSPSKLSTSGVLDSFLYSHHSGYRLVALARRHIGSGPAFQRVGSATSFHQHETLLRRRICPLEEGGAVSYKFRSIECGQPRSQLRSSNTKIEPCGGTSWLNGQCATTFDLESLKGS